MVNLKYISIKALEDLQNNIGANLERYKKDGFGEFESDISWDKTLENVKYDSEILNTLDITYQKNIAELDIKNSKIVGKAFKQLTPALANEERIWVRLAHLEGFNYCKSRWLSGIGDKDIPKAVEKHFFAHSQTGIRDDHALSRLWWNYYIAEICMPNYPDRALELILKTADIRSNFVERIWMSSRQEIASGVLRAMDSDPWITGVERNFREFMKSLNRQGGGIVFEVLNESEVDYFIQDCAGLAKQAVGA